MISRDAIRELLNIFARFTKRPIWTSQNELMLEGAREDIDFAVLRSLSDANFVAWFGVAQLQALYDSGQSGILPAGGSLQLQVPRQWDRLIIARNFDDLLSLGPAFDTIPAAYLICEVPGQSGPVAFVEGTDIQSLPNPLDLYHSALGLWAMIKSFADHTNESGAILFFGTRRIELVPGFSKGDLVRPHWIAPILAFMADPDRAETRKEILLAVLSDMLRDQKPERSFSHILCHTDVLRRQLKEGMAIYRAEHSPEKLAGEARASALAFSDTLEKIISGLEAKGLTIPAAVLLAVKDLQVGMKFSSVNLMILFSLAVFAVTMWFIHLSQHDLITQLGKTIDGAVAELERKGLDSENPVLSDKFASLKKRANRALAASNAIRWASVAPLIGMACFALFGRVPSSPPVNKDPSHPPAAHSNSDNDSH